MMGIKGLLQHGILVKLFPEILIPAKEWVTNNADELTMTWGPKLQEMYEEKPNEESFQVQVHGVGVAVTGNRYDAMFYDDILDKATVRSAVLMEQTDAWW